MIFRAHLTTSFLLMFAISESNVEPTENYPFEITADHIDTHPEDLDLSIDDYEHYSLCKIVTAQDSPFNIGPKQEFTRIYYRELHKCIEKRDKLIEISTDICTFQLNPNFPLLFSILGRYIEIFGQVSINWNQTDVQKIFQELIEAIHITVNSRIEFYTKWIYYPIECHANDWKEYL